MRLLGAALLLYTVLGNDKPKKADPRLKTKPHVWKTSMDDLASVKDASPKKGTWAEPIFGSSNSSESASPTAAAALEAREAAKARKQKTTPTWPDPYTTTQKPAAKPTVKVPVATTTTTTTTTTKAHKYWHPNSTAGPKSAPEAPAVNNSVNFHLRKANQKVASAAPSGPAAAMMGPGPAPAPAPAPLTYEQQVAKLKGDMMTKIKGDSFDADLIIHRPTKVPPGPESAGKENPVGEFKDVGSDFGPYAGQPGFAPAAAPLKHDDISFKTGSLPVDAAHKNRETMTADFGMEYGPKGPVGVHGARPQAGNFKPLEIR